MRGKYQFVQCPQWTGISFTFSRGAISLIYDWFLSLGWFEIRKWRKPVTQEEIDDYCRKQETAENKRLRDRLRADGDIQTDKDMAVGRKFFTTKFQK